MHQPRFAASSAERPLHGAMVHAGHFDGDQVIFQTVLLARLAELYDGQLQLRLLVLDDRRRNEHLAVEVAKHPFRAGLGAIDRDDPKPLRPDLLHAILNHPARLAQRRLRNQTISARFAFCNHSNSSKVGKKSNTSHIVQLEWFFVFSSIGWTYSFTPSTEYTEF